MSSSTTATTSSPPDVWLFSSALIGDPPKPDEGPVEVSDIVAMTHAREHRVFAGRLDRHRLGFGEKAVVMALPVIAGDFRDWMRSTRGVRRSPPN